jgi:hypothetical protein
MTKSKHKGRMRHRLVMPSRAVRTYYWIQDYIKEHGEFPTYYAIGLFLKEGKGSSNYYTIRNTGIQHVQKYLEANGYVERRNAKLYLTDKPMSAGNLIVSSVSD